MPDSITWKQIYEIGVEEIDAEHKVFLKTIQKLREAFDNEKLTPQIPKLLLELYKYVDFHFTSEENVMQRHNYPDLESHKVEHRKLLETLSGIMGSFDNELLQPDELISFLVGWFKNHTAHTDKKFGVFLNSK